MRVLLEAGGPTRALRWVVDGMPGEGTTDGLTTREALRRELLAKGLPESTIEAMLAAAALDGAFAEEPVPLDLPPELLRSAEREAVTVALSVASARATIDQLKRDAGNNSTLKDLYQRRYPRSLHEAGLEAIELIDKFPVLSCQFGYTRDKLAPGEATLRTFRDRKGRYTIHGDLGETEALLVRLDPVRVLAWLRRRGFALADVRTATGARVETLRHAVRAGSGGGHHRCQTQAPTC